MLAKKPGGKQMANQEQLDILKQGVMVWNLWRKEHRGIQPDLSEANLSKADLSKADLGQANLNKADLSEANLEEANLKEANLNFAKLKFANLYGATLIGATLIGASFVKTFLYRATLIGADLRQAYLSYNYFEEADLSYAKLRYANLSGAILTRANLSYANLEGAYLMEAELYGANLEGAYLVRANLEGAYLREANLKEARLIGTTLREANLSDATLIGANLSEVNLSHATLIGANLSDAYLIGATLVETNFAKATLTNCKIYGISAWNVKLEGAIQNNLVITSQEEPTITVDNLEVAQFIYLLLNNKAIRKVIDTITSKVVLILGRFTPERKVVLDALREALRTYGYLPILFDFDKPSNRDLTETVSTLAHLSRFVIADITDAKSIPQELMIIVPSLPSVPVQPLILNSQHEYGMFEHFTRYPWVLPVYRYIDEGSLLQSLQAKVIAPAEQKAQELEKR
jgi:uncharacterized protein YjbI with pentapeptide repeats